MNYQEDEIILEKLKREERHSRLQQRAQVKQALDKAVSVNKPKRSIEPSTDFGAFRSDLVDDQTQAEFKPE